MDCLSLSKIIIVIWGVFFCCVGNLTQNTGITTIGIITVIIFLQALIFTSINKKTIINK